MLLNGTHLMPDLSGALVIPKERMLALSDPIGDAKSRQAPLAAADILRRLASVLRQRRPARVVWLGSALPRLLADNQLAKREANELARLTAAHDWVWVSRDLPEGLPGTAVPELKLTGLTLRHAAEGQGALGEISADPWPRAIVDGRSWPCFVLDGRRMVIPAFGPGTEGVNVLSPCFQSLFRRPFNVLMLAGGRIVTRPRAKLEGATPPPAPAPSNEPAGRRMRLFSGED